MRIDSRSGEIVLRMSIAGAAGVLVLTACAFSDLRAGDGSQSEASGRGTGGRTERVLTPGESIERTEPLRVIVELIEPGKSPGERRKAIEDLQTAVIEDALGPRAIRRIDEDRYGLVRMWSIPVFAINVNKTQMSRLEADPRVRSISPDSEVYTQLDESTAIVQMPEAWDSPYTAFGTGQSIAIIDTGIEPRHKFLDSRRIIAEACFSGGGNTAASFCPNGKRQHIGQGAGRACPASYSAKCSHGTHVAGIASGFNIKSVNGEPAKGVAYRSDIIAIQVFKKNNGNISATTSDILKALDWLYARRKTFPHPLSAINMSLGSMVFSQQKCDNFLLASGPAYSMIISRLRKAGIATVIATGNSSKVGYVASPSCIGPAVAVGASTKRTATEPEQMAVYSNMGPLVDLMAPGGDLRPYPVDARFGAGILSSVAGNTFAAYQGTSMAAPHVAGAFAAIRSVRGCGNKTVKEIETALKQTGTLIEGAGYLRPRINVRHAIDLLGCPSRGGSAIASAHQRALPFKAANGSR